MLCFTVCFVFLCFAFAWLCFALRCLCSASLCFVCDLLCLCLLCFGIVSMGEQRRRRPIFFCKKQMPKVIRIVPCHPSTQATRASLHPFKMTPPSTSPPPTVRPPSQCPPVPSLSRSSRPTRAPARYEPRRGKVRGKIPLAAGRGWTQVPLACIRNMQRFATTNLVANACILYALGVLTAHAGGQQCLCLGARRGDSRERRAARRASGRAPRAACRGATVEPRPRRSTRVEARVARRGIALA